MSDACATVHKLANGLSRHYFPFEETEIPSNGIYILFQKGEKGHGLERIVRIGTHNSEDSLRRRLEEHFTKENKDRSVFRKNIGGALLNQRGDPFLKYWDLDRTYKKVKAQWDESIDFNYHRKLEKTVSRYIRENFSFSVFEVNGKEERRDIEAKLISTVSWCDGCQPSRRWIGKSSPKPKIVQSGLWQEQKLWNTPLNADDIVRLSKLT